ncbi:MAG: acyl-CoA dehydrogenase family protein [Pirellulaceae bacterium]|jgi:alkylation response protein AidB-like acyl-CoA dehydrogenase|nr:acyl-CoA dehydrogenase family protein [Pirellulaceae bacterium]MDP7018948.1 acyl-CoA dehydrogenase family protein [Pirellulaceae bacterium]
MSTDAQRQKQIAEAEEILGDRLSDVGFVKGLFFGQYAADQLLSYPLTVDDETVQLRDSLAQFCREQVDPVTIDCDARIPAAVVAGLGRLGVLGACLPRSCGGRELSQTSYCRLLEVLGGHCGSTALFVNAHHSIGPRALVLFGTPEQQERWLPDLATGKSISAFALTEPEAGSDAGNVQSTAEPTDDGSGFVINGEKRWITNGGIADVLTVMARTPAAGGGSKVTAFIVTPDMPGFRVVEERMEKCGVRGTATSRLAFDNMVVPRENVLGEIGKGLRVALTVLDFGRTTFGASCTGAAKYCVAQAAAHANQRVQFEQTLGEFELVKEKLAHMQAGAFAMEACTYQTAALIDSGESDFMLETAMLKVFSTDVLWRIVNDTIQIFGGKAYFADEPYERMMRDARINMIGEGANDVLRAFSALVGMRDVGLELEGVVNSIAQPIGNLGRLGRFAGRKLGSLFAAPEVPVRSPQLEPDAAALARCVRNLGANVERLLRTYREGIVDRQYLLGRVADAATEVYVGACVLNRLDGALRNLPADQTRDDLQTGRYFLATSARRIRRSLRDLWDHDDAETNKLANALLRRHQ